MSATSPTPTVQGTAPLSIHLQNHCILCLQPESPSSILQTIPSFQPLIYYLTSIDPSDPIQMSEYLSSQKYFPICTSSPSPSNLPPMCATCYPILTEIYRLHQSLIQIQQQLQKQIQLCRQIVKSTVTQDTHRSSQRSNLFKTLGLGLRSILTKEDIKGLRYFIENFHGLIIQAENTYKFPSPPPPPPSSDPHQPPPPPPVNQAALMQISYPVKFERPHFTSTSPAAPSASTSTPNQEVILVSGIDNTIKFEVEDEDDFEDEPLNVVIVTKPDVDIADLQDNPPQHFIVEPDDYPEDDPKEEVTLPLGGDGGGGGGSEAGNIWKVDRQPCDICNKILDLPTLRTHLRGHLSRDPVSCDICSQVYLSKSKLICHYLEMNTGSYCRQRSRWFRNLRYSCDLCNGLFGSEMDLRNHVFSVHEMDNRLEEDWTCNLCSERFRTFEGLDFHTNLHISQAQKRNCWGRLKQLVPPRPPAATSTSSSSSGTPTPPPPPPQMPSHSMSMSLDKFHANLSGNLNVGQLRGSVPWVGGAPDLTCDFCGKQCTGNSALLIHVKKVHKKGGGAGAVKRQRNF